MSDITFTQSAGIGNEVTRSGEGKLINIGGNGLPGSTTQINIGSAAGGTTNIRTYGQLELGDVLVDTFTASTATVGTAAVGTLTLTNPLGISYGGTGNTAGRATVNANLTGPITSVGNATSVASQTGTGSTFVMNTSPTLVTPNLGTPTALVGTNITGTASALNIGGNAATATTASTVTTNANLTGPITSVGNATSIASQTGTGTKFVMDTSPTLITPELGVATATTPAQFDASTKVATTAFVKQQSGNFSSSVVTPVGGSFNSTHFGANVVVTASGQTLSLAAPSGANIGQAIMISAVFPSGTVTINVTGGSNIFNQYAVGAASFTLNAGESAQFTIDSSGFYVVNSYTASPYLAGVSGSIGGGALVAGATATGTVNITGATTAMAVIVTPTAYPGDGVGWSGYVSSSGVVTVVVTGIIAVTPTATTYNVRVIQ